jgi:hypothetical protein
MADLTEIDISKSHASELRNIGTIPIFTQFGTWNDYDNSNIEDYTLYRVYNKTTYMITNRRTNILGGLLV